MTIKQALLIGAKKLKKEAFPALESELLLALALGQERAQIIAHNEDKLKSRQEKKYLSLLKQRLDGLPYAYLKGEKDFYDLNFKVNKQVLIPRPETELMVEEIIKETREKTKNLAIIDLGTGSGAIIISLAKNLGHKKIGFFASDICARALEVAKENAKHYKLDKKIKFSQASLLKPHFDKIKNYNKLIIAANLPYLDKKEIEASPSIKFEPRKALDGGQKGLELYLKLIKEASQIKNKALSLYLEIIPRQKKILEKALGPYFKEITTLKDYTQKDRLIIAKK